MCLIWSLRKSNCHLTKRRVWKTLPKSWAGWIRRPQSSLKFQRKRFLFRNNLNHNFVRWVPNFAGCSSVEQEMAYIPLSYQPATNWTNMSLDLNLWSIWHLALGFWIWRYWWWWAVLIYLADSPAVFLFVFVLKHSKRWRLHIRRSKMLELLFRTGVSVLNHFYCKISVFDMIWYEDWICAIVFYQGVPIWQQEGFFCRSCQSSSFFRGWSSIWRYFSKWGILKSLNRGSSLKWGIPQIAQIQSSYISSMDILQKNGSKHSLLPEIGVQTFCHIPGRGCHHLLNWHNIKRKIANWVLLNE